PSTFFEWVKYRSHLSRGVTLGTMLQDEAFHFLRIGSFLERADNTARLLDVKFHAVDSEFFGFGSATGLRRARLASLQSQSQSQSEEAAAPTPGSGDGNGKDVEFDFYHWSAVL